MLGCTSALHMKVLMQLPPDSIPKLSCCDGVCRTKTPVVEVIRHLSGLWDAAGEQQEFTLHPHPQYEVLRGAGVCWDECYTDSVLSVRPSPSCGIHLWPSFCVSRLDYRIRHA